MIKTRFPTQSDTTWKTIDATLSSAMYPLPDHPVVLLLVSPPSATPTARCLASQLMEISANALRPGPPPPPSQMMISAELLRFNPYTAKQLLNEKLYHHLLFWGVAGINHLEKLSPTNTLTLQTFADNSDLEFNHSQPLMVLTLELKEDDEAQDENCNLEAKAKLSQDNFSSLISRVVANVVPVRPEISCTDSLKLRDDF